MRVVGLERRVVLTDLVNERDPDRILEEGAENVIGVVGRGTLLDVLLAVAPAPVGLPYVVDAFQQVRDPADLRLGEQHLQARVAREHAGVQVVGHGAHAVAEDDRAGYRLRRIV